MASEPKSTATQGLDAPTNASPSVAAAASVATASAAAPVVPGSAASASAAQRGPMASILVVDDSALARHHLAELLRRQGFEIRTAEDGLQAIACIRAHRPALIVMDVVMPGANGYQVTRALARDPDTRDIPVILCTTKDAESDRIWGLRQGARAYVTKPIDAGALLACISELLK